MIGDRLEASVLLCVVCLLPFTTRATSATPGETEADLQLMKSADWQARRSGFYDLLAHGLGTDPHGKTYLFSLALKKLFELEPKRQAEIKSGLIALLDQENALVHTYELKGRTMNEEQSDYYGDVIGAVAALRTPASIDSLLGALGTGGMATRTLASFGDAALDPLISKLSDSDSSIRSGAVTALSQMMDKETRQSLHAASRLKIEQALLRATSDRDVGVRLSAVDGLGNFGDPESISALERLAASDPACLQGQADEGRDLYPVRNAARRALEKAKSGPPT
jgi:hypothetical protein